MKKRVNLIPAISLAVALLALQPVAASAANRGQHAEGQHPSVVGTIHGQGRSEMTDLVAAGMKGRDCGPAIVAAQHCAVSTFGIDVTLYSDGTAKGKLNCVDIVGDPPGYPGKIFGDVTNWSRDVNIGAVTLIVPHGKLIDIKGSPEFEPQAVPFSVTIQHFGGAGVGHWTLDGPNGTGGTITFCFELLTSGRIVGKGEIFRDEG